jgi:hypothetical protein
MTLQSKKGSMAMEVVIGIAILLLVAWVMYTLIMKSGGTANDLFTECSGMGGGIWSPNRCDSSVSVESPIVERAQLEGVLHYCCIPLPGKREKFDITYENEYKSDINQHGTDLDTKELKKETSRSKKSSGSSSSSGTSIGSTAGMDSSIHFILNGEEISHITTKTYSANIDKNGLIYSRDKQEFKVSQTLSDKGIDVGRCMFVVRPAMVYDSAGEKKIKSNTGATADFVVTKSSGGNCEDSISITDITLDLLAGTSYSVPGFYKWDFIYWEKGSTAENGDGSATTYIAIQEGTSGTSSNSGDIDKADLKYNLIIYDEIISSRNNEATCYLSAVVVDNYGDEYFPLRAFYEKTDSSTAPQSYSGILDGKSKSFDIGLTDYVHFSFGLENSPSDDFNYGFKNCDKIEFMSINEYRNKFFGCSRYALVCDYAKSACVDAFSRPGADCEKNVEDCVWKKDFPLGDCLICSKTTVSTCADYDNRKTCESNQCFGTDGMNERCFYNLGNCEKCVFTTTNPCAQYKKIRDCNGDPCKLKEFTSKVCSWESGECVSS